MTLLSLTLPLMAFAKGDTIRIEIRGGTLAAPIEITDRTAVRRFNVWSGPGTDPTIDPDGLNADWSRGEAHPSTGLKIYIVSFVTTRSNPGTYVVHYAVDPVSKQGYVYIPGKADANYRENVWLIYRGIEGHWFYASEAWQAVADLLISRQSVSPKPFSK